MPTISKSPAPAPVAARPRHRARRACSSRRRRPEAFDQPAPRGHAPPRAALPRARRSCCSSAGVLNLWALRSQRLGQRVLQRRRALDELELAQLPLRLVRPERAHDGGQAAARPLGPGALGPGLRLSFVEHPRAAGAHGRRDRRAGLRPDAPHVGAHGRLRRRARARGHADHRRHLAPQQPRCAAGAVLRRRPVVPRARAAGRPHALDRARGRVRRPRLRDEDGRRPARRARDRRGLAVGRAARPARRGAPAARRRRRDGRRRRRLAAADDAHARRRAARGSRARATTASSA